MLLRSITEGDRLSSMLQNSQTRTFSDNGDPIFLVRNEFHTSPEPSYMQNKRKFDEVGKIIAHK